MSMNSGDMKVEKTNSQTGACGIMRAQPHYYTPPVPNRRPGHKNEAVRTGALESGCCADFSRLLQKHSQAVLLSSELVRRWAAVDA